MIGLYWVPFAPGTKDCGPCAVPQTMEGLWLQWPHAPIGLSGAGEKTKWHFFSRAGHTWIGNRAPCNRSTTETSASSTTIAWGPGNLTLFQGIGETTIAMKIQAGKSSIQLFPGCSTAICTCLDVASKHKRTNLVQILGCRLWDLINWISGL